MHKLLRFIGTMIMCSGLLSNPIFGNNVLKINDLTKEIEIDSAYVTWYEDLTQRYDIQKVKENINLFKPLESKYLVIKNTSAAYWAHVSLDLSELKNQQVVLENIDFHIDDFELYIEKPDGQLIAYAAGYDKGFRERKFYHKNFVFEFPQVDRVELYVRMKSKFHNPMILKVRSFSYFSYYALSEYYFLGIFYGIMFIMAIYNLMLFISIREKLFLYYVVYVITSIAITFSEDGLGFQYFWPGLPQLNNFISQYAPALMLVSFTLYAKKFLDIERLLPRFNLVINIMTGLFLGYLFLIIIGIRLPWNPAYFIIPFSVTYVAALMCLNKGYRTAKYFVLAYSFLLFSLVILVLRQLGWSITDNIYTIYSLNFGLVLEVVIFSYALSSRYRRIKEEKEKADQDLIRQLRENELLKDKVNRELEQKVQERTHELREANEELALQAEEIHRMNLLLNKENINLQENVKEITEARVLVKEVDLSEFSKVFPDDEACLKYLTELKWNKEYKCRKCGNTKHTLIADPYARRCTKCRYNESATAFTIFHKCKFPIKKAFYMLFIIYTHKEKVTSQQLSDLLELRLSTCWTFSKKIYEILKTKKRPAKNKGMEGWSSLIFSVEEAPKNEKAE